MKTENCLSKTVNRQFPRNLKLFSIYSLTFLSNCLCSMFLQYLNRYIGIKKPTYDRYSVLFTVTIAWLFALFLTSCSVYNHKSESTQNSCRTDRAGLITAAPW